MSNRSSIGTNPPLHPALERRSGTHAIAPRPTYDRAKDLPRVLPMWPSEYSDLTPERHRLLIQRLRRALREERRRGLAGCWTYDLARHARLARVVEAEVVLADQAVRTAARIPGNTVLDCARRRRTGPATGPLPHSGTGPDRAVE